MVNIKQVGIALTLAGMILLAGCAGLGGSPELTYEGQQYQEVSFTEVEIGFEGTMTNTGDAPAENVSVVFMAELPSGETYKSTSYIGDIDEGESKEWSVGFTLDEGDGDKNWQNADWTIEIRGDNMETETVDLTKE